VPAASPDLQFWHRRYQHQASWTASLRAHAYEATGLSRSQRILEVGSGTGVITAELRSQTTGHVVGVDIDAASAMFSAQVSPGPRYAAADGRHLPFDAGRFDTVAAHFLLLWVRDPLSLLKESFRVVCPGGWVLCLAEPDYGGRLDYPPSVANLGRLQTYALQAQGADPFVGRRLRSLLLEAGFRDVTAGVIGATWTNDLNGDAVRSEQETLEADLRGLATGEEMDRWREADLEARQRGSRILFVPTFYAFGRKPPT